MKKTNSIYLYKIIFTFIVALCHYPILYRHIYNHGGVYGLYVVVDAFFMISGYLLYKNIDRYKERYDSAWKYTLNKYKQMWPKYIATFIMTFIVICYVEEIRGFGILKKLYDSFFEIILLQAIGLNREWDYINPPTWYISVIIIVGYVMFYMLSKHRDVFVRFIAPICLVIGFSYIYRNVGSMDAVKDTFGVYGNTPLIRGFCDMCLGMYAVKVNEFLQDKIKKTWILKLFANVLLVITLVSGAFSEQTSNDFAFIGILFIIIAIGFVPRKRFAIDGFIEKFSSLTLNIYLLHEVFRTYIMPQCFGMPEDLKTEIVYTLIYLALIIVSAIIMELVWKGYKKLAKRGVEKQ